MYQGIFSCQKQKHSQGTSRKGRCGGEVASKSFTWPGTKTASETRWGGQAAPQPHPALPGGRADSCLALNSHSVYLSQPTGWLPLITHDCCFWSWAPPWPGKPPQPLSSDHVFWLPLSSPAAVFPRQIWFQILEWESIRPEPLCSSPCLRALSSLWKWISLGSSSDQSSGLPVPTAQAGTRGRAWLLRRRRGWRMDKSVKEGNMDPHTRACTSPWKVLVLLNSVALGSLITACRVSRWPPCHMLTEPGSRLGMGRVPWERQWAICRPWHLGRFLPTARGPEVRALSQRQPVRHLLCVPTPGPSFLSDSLETPLTW